MNKLIAFESYLECALWASCDENGVPLDENFYIEDFDDETKEKLAEEFTDFFDSNYELIEQLPDWYDAGMLGHDFWLTRNGHGAGFWDRGLGQLGSKLSDISKVYGELTLHSYENKVYCL